jgi:putative peptidoglycan lipid II flippase
MLLGGFAALAEAAWMGAPQATEVLDPLRVARPGITRLLIPRLPRLRLSRLLRSELSIAEASFVLMASFFVSALLGAVRQVLFNADFGAGSTASAYYAAFRLPDTLFSLIAGGALSSAMIPVLLTTTREEGEAGGARLANLVLTTLVAFFALVVAAGEVLAPAFVGHVLAPGFDPHTSHLATNLTRLMLLQPLILAGGSVAIAILNSRNQFLLTAVSIASHNVALIAGILATRVDPALGIYGPTLGVVGGAALQVLILLPGLRARGFHYRPTWNLRDRRLREVVRLLVPNGLAVGVGYCGFIVDTAFASTAKEHAALPAIANAWLLVTLPIALFGQAIGQAAFPRLAAYADARKWRELRATLKRSLNWVIALAIPAAIGMLVLSKPVIRVLFEHGKFGATAGSLTGKVLVAYAIALPAAVTTEVLARGLIALRDTRTPLFANSAQLLGRALIMAVLVGAAGVVAIPIAFAAMAFVEALALATVLVLRLRGRAAVVQTA